MREPRAPKWPSAAMTPGESNLGQNQTGGVVAAAGVDPSTPVSLIRMDKRRTFVLDSVRVSL